MASRSLAMRASTRSVKQMKTENAEGVPRWRAFHRARCNSRAGNETHLYCRLLVEKSDDPRDYRPWQCG